MIYAPRVIIRSLLHLAFHLRHVQDCILGLIIVRLDIVHGKLGRLFGEACEISAPYSIAASSQEKQSLR